ESSAASETALMLMSELADNQLLEQKATAARTLGSTCISLGRFDEAFDMLDRAHSLIPENNLGQTAAVLRTFGALFLARGQLSESLAYQQQAFHLADDNNSPREIARIMAALGSVSYNRGDFNTALAYCEQVLHMNRQDDNIYFQILDLQKMSSIYRALFAYDIVLQLCDEAEPLQAHIRHRDPILQMNRALCLIATGRADTGLE